MARGDRRAIARLITFVENDLAAARDISRAIFYKEGKASIVGVTGAPGVGKSSLVNQLVSHLVSNGNKVAIVAIDPTSPFSGGALLGDRIRMKDNYSGEHVFMRSMANRGRLGGLSRATKDTIGILDAAGYDVIIVETVGVGQGEIDVYRLAHTTLVVLVPGMGDEIQTFKAGIMEICDVFVINKMDHDGTERLAGEIESMLDLTENVSMDHDDNHVMKVTNKVASAGWRPPVCKTNAITGAGVPELWSSIEAHRDWLSASGNLSVKLKAKARAEILDILKDTFTVHLEDSLDVSKNGTLDDQLSAVAGRACSPYDVADAIGKKVASKVSSPHPAQP